MSSTFARRLHARLLDRFTSSRPASFWASAVLLVSVALLVAMVAFFAAPGVGKEPSAIHITHAEWQVEEAPGFRELPLAVQSDALPATWQTVELPPVSYTHLTLPTNREV